jgi:hypothetical protein
MEERPIPSPSMAASDAKTPEPTKEPSKPTSKMVARKTLDFFFYEGPLDLD